MSLAGAPQQSDAGQCYAVLGVRVDAVQIPDAVRTLETWIQQRCGCRYVAVTGMHGLCEAHRDPSFRSVLNSAGLVVADGMPLVWLGRWYGKPMRRRVYGPEVMLAFCQESMNKGYRHFFYGGGPGVAAELSRILSRDFPGLQVAGTYCPPFRPLTDAESCEVVAIIERAAPDVIWVGLSTPKQEKWMHEFAQRLNVPAMVGVGAAFDFVSARARQAPLWMREHGLEWLFRLVREPRRLWRRYLLNGPRFAFWVLLQLLSRNRSSQPPSRAEECNYATTTLTTDEKPLQ